VRKLVLLIAVLATAASASSAYAITYGTVDVNNTYSYVGGLVTDLNRSGELVEPFVTAAATSTASAAPDVPASDHPGASRTVRTDIDAAAAAAASSA
jgi:hypothetical protein